jgi:hypothetical protein
MDVILVTVITLILMQTVFLFQRSHLSELTGMDVFLKKDFLQYTGR